MRTHFAAAAAASLLLCAANAFAAEPGGPSGPSAADCAAIKAADQNAREAAVQAWGWNAGLHGQTSIMSWFFGKSEYSLREDAAALDAFLRTPAVVTDPTTRYQYDCRPMQQHARAVRGHYTELVNRLRAARESCNTSTKVQNGECGRVAGQALEFADRLREGPVRDFEATARSSPGACKRSMVVRQDLSTPLCLRRSELGTICSTQSLRDARYLLAEGVAKQLGRIKDPTARFAAQAALTPVNGAIQTFDRFTSGGGSDAKLLLTASIQTESSKKVVRDGLAGQFCASAAAPQAAPEPATRGSGTQWRRRLRPR